MPEPVLGFWAGAIASVIAALGGARGIVTLWRRFFAARERVTAIRADNEAFKSDVRKGLTSLDARVQGIEHQLGPNGGKSYGAKLDRVHDMTRRIDARVSATTNVISTPIFEANAEGEVTWVNRRMELMTGYSRAELLGKGWLAAIHPDDRGRVNKEWHAAVDDKRIFESDFRLRHRARCGDGEGPRRGHAEFRRRRNGDHQLGRRPP
jgi:PAS domain S-box-containing protein